MRPKNGPGAAVGPCLLAVAFTVSLLGCSRSSGPSDSIKTASDIADKLAAGLPTVDRDESDCKGAKKNSIGGQIFGRDDARSASTNSRVGFRMNVSTPEQQADLRQQLLARQIKGRYIQSKEPKPYFGTRVVMSRTLQPSTARKPAKVATVAVTEPGDPLNLGVDVLVTCP